MRLCERGPQSGRRWTGAMADGRERLMEGKENAENLVLCGHGIFE